MIKLVYLIRKRPDLSRDAFLALWRDVHATLVRSLAETIGARGYEIGASVEGACRESLRLSRGFAPSPYDGLLEIRWDDLEAYQRGFSSPEGLQAIERMIDAERRFIDFSRSTAFLVEGETVFSHDLASKALQWALEAAQDAKSAGIRKARF